MIDQNGQTGQKASSLVMALEWSLNPLIAAALLLPTWAYVHGVMTLWRRGGMGRGVAGWQTAAFVGGMAALVVALMSPLEALSEALLSGHMVQHMLLIMVAPPLLVVGTPPTIFLWALPLKGRRAVARWFAPTTLPGVLWRLVSGAAAAWIIHAAALWLWHLPVVYEAAVLNPTVHVLEHVSFFGAALLFWNAALPRSPRRALVGVAMVLTTALHSGLLGALMTFSGQVWYPVYASSTPNWGLTPLEDQQLAGVIMWIPAGVIYLVAGLALLGLWLRGVDQAAA